MFAALAAARAHLHTDPLAALKAADALVTDSVGGGLNMRPNTREVRGSPQEQWRIALNAEGFRESRPTPRAAPAGTRRFVALGDSVIFGHGIDQGATLSDQLEEVLPPLLGGPVDVVNAGVFGAAAFDMYRRYTRLAEAYTFDDVILGFPQNEGRQSALAEVRAEWRDARGRPKLAYYLPFERSLLHLYARPTPEPAPLPLPDPTLEDLWALVVDARRAGHRVWLLQTPRPLAAPYAKANEVLTALTTGLDLPVARPVLDHPDCWSPWDHSHPSAAGVRVLARALAEVIATGTSAAPDPGAPRCAAEGAPR